MERIKRYKRMFTIEIEKNSSFDSSDLISWQISIDKSTDEEIFFIRFFIVHLFTC